MVVDVLPRAMAADVLLVTVVDALRVTAADAPLVMAADTQLLVMAAAIRRRVTEADRRMTVDPRTAVDRTVAAADMGGNIALEFFPAW